MSTERTPLELATLEATKQVHRSRHHFIMHMAKNGYKKDEINAIVLLIDWGKEITWLAEDLVKAEEAKRNAPVNIPIPPTPDANPEVVPRAVEPERS